MLPYLFKIKKKFPTAIMGNNNNNNNKILYLSEIRSEVFTRTDEWKTATFGIGVLAFNFSNYYTENSVFLLEIIPRFTGPPDGASGLVVFSII